MLTIIDESGDTGLKIGQGSSSHFVVTAVSFTDRNEASRCERSIMDVRRSLKYPESFEFRFSKNSDATCRRFLQAVAPFEFRYDAFVLDKQRIVPESSFVQRLRKESVVSMTAGYVLSRCIDELCEATVIIDGSGTKEFRSRLSRDLRSLCSGRDPRPIRKVKVERSYGNNLVQLADMISDAVFRSFTKGDRTYRDIVRRHERAVNVWPD